MVDAHDGEEDIDMTRDAEKIVEQWAAIKQMREVEAQMNKQMEQMQKKIRAAEVRKKVKKGKK